MVGSTKNGAAHDLVRRAVAQESLLDLWLSTNIPTDQQPIYEALMQLQIWRLAVRQPEPPHVKRERALIELAQATTTARAVIDRLETLHGYIGRNALGEALSGDAGRPENRPAT